MQAAALGFQNVLGVLVLCPAVILHQAVFPPMGVRRWSALSCRRVRRYSLRLVIIR